MKTQLSSSMSLNTVPDADIELAACYVSDALEGRTEDCSAQMVGRPSWERRMYSLNTWFVWEIWLQLIGIMLMLRAFIEPGYSLSGLECHASPHDGPYDLLLLALEALGLSCFWLDIYAKFAYMGREQYWSRAMHRGYLLVVIGVTVDALVGAACSQRPLRWLRPMLIGLRNNEQRRILLSLLHLLSHQLGVALLSTIGVVAFAGAFGVHLYGESFDQGLELHEAALEGGEFTDLNHLKGTFDSFVHAAVEIWVFISSAENFLDLLLPAMRTADGGHSFLPLLVYFGPLLYFGYFFLMSVLLAVVVDEYLLTARRLVQQEHHRERKGLLEAFALLNPSRTGYVDVRTWTRLLVYLRPECSRQEAILRYHMVAHQAPERGVYVREFLRLHSNLAVNLVEEYASGQPEILRALPDSVRLTLLVINAILFVTYSPLQSAFTHRALFAAHTLLLPPLNFDRKSWSPSRRHLNGGCLGVANACALLYWFYDIGLGQRPPIVANLFGHVALFALLVQGSRMLRLIWRLLSYVLPQFLAVSASVFLIVYVFGLLGMQLFHSLPLTSADERYAHENLAGCAQPFGSLPCTLFVLFQVMTNEDWHVVLRAMWSTAGPVGLAYVLAFFLVVNVCLLSLTTALAINAFLASKTDLLDQGLLVDNSVDVSAGAATTSPFADVPSRSPSRAGSPPPALERSPSRAGGGSPSALLGGTAPGTAPGTPHSPSSVRAAGERVGGAHVRSACAALHAHDDETEHAVDEHQDLHLGGGGSDLSRTKRCLQQAELAMREHEAVSFRDEGRPAFARPLRSAPSATSAAKPTLYGCGLGRSDPARSTRSDLRQLAKTTAPKEGGSAIARAAFGGKSPPSRTPQSRRASAKDVRKETALFGKETSLFEAESLLPASAPRSDAATCAAAVTAATPKGGKPGGGPAAAPSACLFSASPAAGQPSQPLAQGAAGASASPAAEAEQSSLARGLSLPKGLHVEVGEAGGDISIVAPPELDRHASVDSIDLERAGDGQIATLLGAANAPPSPVPSMPLSPGVSPGADDPHCGKYGNKKWRVASRTVTMFSRRAAAGLGGGEEPLDDEETAAIAELTQHEG